MVKTRKWPWGIGVAQLGPCSLVGVAALQLTSEAHACSQGFSGWQRWVLAGGPADGIVSVFTCSGGCGLAPEMDVAVRDEQGELVAGALAVSESRTAMAWFVWKPEAPLTLGATYQVSLSGSGDAAVWEHTYQVLEVGPTLATVAEPTLEATGFVEFLGGEVCCEEGERNNCGTLPLCFPERSNARSRVNMSLQWAQTGWGFLDVRFSGEFFTANERRLVEPQVGGTLQGMLAPTEADDAYCYKITAQHLLTDETRVFEGCTPATGVELPDAQAERQSRNHANLMSCTVVPAKYEAEWCAAFSREVTAQSCTQNARASCANALATCPDPDAVHLEPAATSSCNASPQRSGTSGAGLAALGTVLAGAAARGRGCLSRRRRPLAGESAGPTNAPTQRP